MKFNNIVIGGGLSGLTCGITLAKAGKKVAIISAGQSTLHFSSGSFDLLGYDEKGNVIDSPIECLSQLSQDHPYQKIGIENIKTLAQDAKIFLTESGLNVKGQIEKNHYRVTPMGVMKPTWLTLEDYLTSESSNSLPFKKVLLANFAGFHDFPIGFIAEGLKKSSTEVETTVISISALKERRHSPSEMRSANISKVLSNEDSLQEIADKLNSIDSDAEIIILPAIIGLNNDSNITILRSKVKKPLYMVATLPPSVPGVRVQMCLRNYFEKLGGTFMLGGKVESGTIENNKILNIESAMLPKEKLEADNYILATGSFQSEGLKSNYNKVYEPIFDLDVDASANRTEWVDTNVYNAQPYMKYGVKTNKMLQTQKNNITIENFYAIGSVLSGHNAIKQADGSGVSLITALAVANNILNK